MMMHARPKSQSLSSRRGVKASPSQKKIFPWILLLFLSASSSSTPTSSRLKNSEILNPSHSISVSVSKITIYQGDVSSKVNGANSKDTSLIATSISNSVARHKTEENDNQNGKYDRDLTASMRNLNLSTNLIDRNFPRLRILQEFSVATNMSDNNHYSLRQNKKTFIIKNYKIIQEQKHQIKTENYKK